MKIHDTLSQNEEYDQVLLDILERGMKEIYLNHARKMGATDEWIDSIKDSGSFSIAQVVSVIYGDPPLIK